jgi:nitrate/TMAO reductase-like tetraheme cytochrome c subunit
MLVLSVVMLSGCRNGDGTATGSSAQKSVVINGSFNPNDLAAKRVAKAVSGAAGTAVGTVTAVDALTGLVMGSPVDILSNNQFNGLTLTVPDSNRLVVVLVADLTGVGKYRMLLPIDLSNLAPDSLMLTKPISLAISPKSEEVVAAAEKSLGVAGKLGDAGIIMPAGTDFNVAVNSVTSNGGAIIASSTNALSLTGTIDPSVYPKMTVSATATPAEMTGFGSTVNLSASVTNAPAGATVTYSYSTTPVGPLNTFTATNLGLPATIAANGNSAAFTTKTAKECMGYLTATTLEDGVTPVLSLRDKLGLTGINNLQLAMISYVVHVTATAGPVSATTDVIVTPTNKQNGVNNVSVGTIALVNTTEFADLTLLTPFTPVWSMTAKPDGSSAALNETDGAHPWFRTDLPGKYTISDGTSSINIYAGKYSGMGSLTGVNDTDFAAMNSVTLTGTSKCGNCHNVDKDNKAPFSIFTAMVNSGHSRIFSRNVIANAPPAGHYSTGCLECHAVGYIPGVSGNDGFADAVAALNYTLPKTSSNANWSALDSRLKGLANAQCENCHGPNGEGSAHASGIANRVSYDAELCADCHGEPGRHNRYQLWQQSTHGAGLLRGSTETAYELAYAEGASASCARCHSAQGFKMWTDQINSGVIPQANILKYISSSYIRNTATNGPSTNTATSPNYILSVLGINRNQLAPVTCTACHMPHNSGLGTAKVNTRVYDQTKGTSIAGLPAGYVGALPAGFSFGYAGTGSLCFYCHNSRNGLHEDAVRDSFGKLVVGGTAAAFGRVTSVTIAYSAPHAAGQADVFSGRNAYFMNGRQIISGHTNVKNTCVGCHMESVAATNGFGGTNHTMKATNDVCKVCHGITDGKAFQDYVVRRLADLNTFALVYFNQVLIGQKLNADLKNSAGVVQLAKGTTITSVDKVVFGRAPALYVNGVTAVSAAIGNSASSIIRININPGKAGEYIAKINWNQQLVEATSVTRNAAGNAVGGSRGIHNPEFTRTVLENTIANIINAPTGI